MGVWDTVDAVGLPLRAADFVNRVIYAFKFPDRTLSTSVAHACHALALETLWRHPWLMAWLVVTLWLGLEVDRRLDRKYSRFWRHDHMRLKLRNMLGLR